MYLAALVVLLGLLNGAFSLTLNIEPKKVHVKPNETFTVMCKSDVPLSGCQFAWKNQLLHGSTIDFSLGPASPVSANQREEISTYSYTGSGLDNGECGMSISISRWGSRIIGCRVHQTTGGWVYADVGVQIDAQPSFPLVAVPSEAVVKLGENVNISCIADEPLNDCTISVPGVALGRFNLGHQSQQTKNMKYFGTGLEQGQCGVSLLEVTEKYNGRVICAARTAERKGFELSTVDVIVAQAPSEMALNIEQNPVPYGAQLQASCTVRDGRPDPTITWYLGAEKIRQDSVDDSPPSIDWAWKNITRTITQTITRPVTRADNGKQLRCEANHVALPDTLVQRKVIAVETPPKCRALKVASLDPKCVFRDEEGVHETSCSEPSPAGTVAHLHCKIGYIISAPHPGYSSVSCTEDGFWSPEIYKCVLNCGKRNVKGGETLISHGETALVGEFPWHVAIYQKVGATTIKHICGGTLIKPDLVVSAAHCFWNNTIGAKTNASLYKVAAGKHHREWDAPERVAPQKSDVEAIYIPDRFRGRELNFADDIALLRLSSPVTITSHANVICIDWENERHNFILYDGNNGTVPGWGFTEHGRQSDELKVVNLPFIPFHRCYDALPIETREILTAKKFCAGYVNKNISVCKGDSGGGLVFFDGKTDRYYIRGIVSIAFKPFVNKDICFAQLYTGFTSFSDYLVWVKGYFNSRSR